MSEITELQDLPDAPLAVYDTPVVMVGGGAVDDAQLETLARHYPLIAVDSGANHIHDMGLKAEMLIGDFDSVKPSGRDQIEKQIRIRDQNSTDFQKALKVISAPKIYALGFLGKRTDHSLGALHVLAEYLIAHDGERALILVDPYELVVMQRRAFSKKLPQGIRLSFHSMLPQRFMKTKGLVWPMNGFDVGTGFNLAICNQVIIPPGEAEGDIQVEAHTDNDAPFAVLMDPSALSHF